MAYAFEIGDELPAPPIRAEVEADIVDWKARLTDLMDSMAEWALEIPEVRVERGPWNMLERKMTLVGITKPLEMPSLLVYRVVETTRTPLPEKMWTLNIRERVRRHEASMSVMPDARWVIGTRGQIRLRSSHIYETVMDLGEQGRPDWRVLERNDFEIIPFTKELFQEIVKGLK